VELQTPSSDPTLRPQTPSHPRTLPTGSQEVPGAWGNCELKWSLSGAGKGSPQMPPGPAVLQLHSPSAFTSQQPYSAQWL
jgi:hypothetical protein